MRRAPSRPRLPGHHRPNRAVRQRALLPTLPRLRLAIRRKIVEEYLFDLLTSFAADGFRHLVLTSQHVDPPWVRTAQSACERVNEECGARAIHGFERLVVDLLEDPSRLDSSGLDSRGEAHAGVYETAPMLHIREHLVRKQLLKELPPMPIEFSQFESAESFRELGNELGYTGDLLRAAGKEI